MFATPILAALTLFLGLTQTGTDDSTRVRGTVTTGGVENRPIPNALVVASSDSDVRETRADASGRYVFLTLLPGVYQLSAYPSGAKRTDRMRPGQSFLSTPRLPRTGHWHVVSRMPSRWWSFRLASSIWPTSI